MTGEEIFFREWHARRAGERRSLARAKELADRLGLPGRGPTILTVVGSKGKGTTATYASAYLAAAGLRVLTITSPGFRGHRERIRVDGRAIAAADLERLAQVLDSAIGPYAPGSGYLSPSGLFIMAGLLHGAAVEADVVVLEAGRGGSADEASLFPAEVVAITGVFGEHLGQLGGSVEAAARDKAGVVAPSTRAVLSVPQIPTVEQVITDVAADRTGGSVKVETVLPGSSGVAPEYLSTGLNTMNAELGCVSALRILGRGAPAPAMLENTLTSISLPGRLSWHLLPGTRTRLLVDSAITRAATALALATARAEWGTIDHVLLSLPDDKDLDGAIAELPGLPVTFVRLRSSHLTFTRPIPREWTVLESAALDRDYLAGLGRRLVAIGTISLTARLLHLVDAQTEVLFTV